MIDILQKISIILHSEGGITMYEKMYHILFNAITHAMDRIEEHNDQEALIILERACREAEEVYISQ